MSSERMIDASGRPCLLMVVPVMPSDRGNGLAMRAGLFLDAYSERFAVDLVVVPVAGADAVSAFARRRTRRIDVLELGAAETHYALLAAIGDADTRLAAFRAYGKPTFAARIGPLKDALAAYAADGRYALVHIFRLYLAELAAPWLRRGNATRLVLDCDENDASVFRRIATVERRRGNLHAAAWAEAEADAFARLIPERLRGYDIILAASAAEAGSLSAAGARVDVVANTVKLPRTRPPRRRGGRPTILFVGTLSYAPNAEAVQWFAARVWPRLRRRLGGYIRLVVVGRKPPAAIRRLRGQGIEVVADAADIAPYYHLADMAIVPVRAGGGTRIKIIEAAAFAVPVVSTRFGADGTTFQAEIDMLVADGADGLLRACLRLLRNSATRSSLAQRSRARLRRDYAYEVWKARILRLAGVSE